jgi:hypothetical protein
MDSDLSEFVTLIYLVLELTTYPILFSTSGNHFNSNLSIYNNK